MCIYIYIYIYICSRGPVAAGNHQKNNDGNHTQMFLATTETIQKPTTETINKHFPATTEIIKQPATETSPKHKRKRGIARYILKCWILLRRQNPPKSSDGNHKQRFPATTETIQKTNDGNHKQTFPAKTETINKKQRRKP